jgi:hypothetical protein
MRAASRDGDRLAAPTHGVQRQAQLYGGVEIGGVRTQDTPEFVQSLTSQASLPQRNAEPLADVVEGRAAFECLAVRLYRLPEVAHFAVGIPEARVQVRELRPGDGVRRACLHGRDAGPTKHARSAPLGQRS